MLRSINQLFRGYEPYEIILELAVIWICVYLVFRFLRGTRGAGIIKGVAVVLVVFTLLIRVLGQASDAFGRLNFIYDRFLALLAILIIVVFQPELRQAMIQLGQARLFRGAARRQDAVIESVSDAAGFLSKNQFGALIAIERTVKLGGLLEGGETIDARVSTRLLECIFWPNSPLHDLGVVIRDDRIIAANVQFPLAEGGVVSSRLGSRHRAAVGLTLESDCVVVIVSEETGGIAVAENGVITSDLSGDELKVVLAEHLSGTGGEPPASAGKDVAPPTERPTERPTENPTTGPGEHEIDTHTDVELPTDATKPTALIKEA